MGRKRLADDVGRTRFVQLRVSPPFKTWLDRYADSKGQSLTELIFGHMTKAAKRDRFEAPPPR